MNIICCCDETVCTPTILNRRLALLSTVCGWDVHTDIIDRICYIQLRIRTYLRRATLAMWQHDQASYSCRMRRSSLHDRRARQYNSAMCIQKYSRTKLVRLKPQTRLLYKLFQEQEHTTSLENTLLHMSKVPRRLPIFEHITQQPRW